MGKDKKQSESQKKFLIKFQEKKERLSELQKRAYSLSKKEQFELARLSLFMMKNDIGNKFYKRHKVKWTGFTGVSPDVNQKAKERAKTGYKPMTKARKKAQEKAEERKQMSFFE